MAVLYRRRSTTLIIAICAVSTLWYLSNLTESYAPQSLSKAPRPGTDDFGAARVHWRKTAERYPVKDFIQLPSLQPQTLPRLQHVFEKESAEDKTTREERQAIVKKSFERTWQSYKSMAWMRDELRPLSGEYYTSFGGWAATLVDALDTLWIMDMKDEFEHAVKAAATIDFTTTDSDMLNIFETTIRYLGGFLGAYDISGGQYPILLEKAVQLAEILYCAFDTPNRFPVARWYWKQSLRSKQQADELCVIAEVGSLTVEFTRLAQLTGENRYYDAVARITTVLEQVQLETSIPGLWPTIINARALDFSDNSFSLGGMADSLYEYLPKQYMLLGGANNQYKSMYEHAISAAKKHIFFRPMLPTNNDVLISGNAQFTKSHNSINLDPQSQHLGCFVGGMLAIGAKLFDRADDLSAARKIVNGCVWAYDSMATGLMPETFHLVPCGDVESCVWNETVWHAAVEARHPSFFKGLLFTENIQTVIQEERLPRGYTAIGDRRYILRPEAIESIFVLYRITGDRSLQDTAWRMWLAIDQRTRTTLANAAIKDVTVEPADVEREDRMESFWLAETLKYFYLVFSEPHVVSLDDFVL
ncbi:hypothetical protein MMC19_006907 [Ptychographa xylographoides]|nr:hypothetical protein [Ptychographa xylographoides]